MKTDIPGFSAPRQIAARLINAGVGLALALAVFTAAPVVVAAYLTLE